MATKVIKATLRFKRGTAAEWRTVNPVLKLGEPGYVTDLNKLKVGNGEDEWDDLPYLTGSGSMSLAADGKSVEIYLEDDTQTLRIKDFNDAAAGDIPQKGLDGKIHWVDITEELDEKVEQAAASATQAGTSATTAGTYATQAIQAAAQVEAKFWYGTMEEYNALETIRASTIYIILDE